MNDDELKEFLGPIGFGEYEKAPDWDKPKIREWAVEVSAMSSSELISETATRVLDDAIMQNRRGNNYGFYARTTGCYRESERRKAEAGHAKDCTGTTLYELGHTSAVRSQGHKTQPVRPCDCGLAK